MTVIYHRLYQQDDTEDKESQVIDESGGGNIYTPETVKKEEIHPDFYGLTEDALKNKPITPTDVTDLSIQDILPTSPGDLGRTTYFPGIEQPIQQGTVQIGKYAAPVYFGAGAYFPYGILDARKKALETAAIEKLKRSVLLDFKPPSTYQPYQQQMNQAYMDAFEGWRSDVYNKWGTRGYDKLFLMQNDPEALYNLKILQSNANAKADIITESAALHKKLYIDRDPTKFKSRETIALSESFLSGQEDLFNLKDPMDATNIINKIKTSESFDSYAIKFYSNNLKETTIDKILTGEIDRDLTDEEKERFTMQQSNFYDLIIKQRETGSGIFKKDGTLTPEGQQIVNHLRHDADLSGQLWAEYRDKEGNIIPVGGKREYYTDEEIASRLDQMIKKESTLTTTAITKPKPTTTGDELNLPEVYKVYLGVQRATKILSDQTKSFFDKLNDPKLTGFKADSKEWLRDVIQFKSYLSLATGIPSGNIQIGSEKDAYTNKFYPTVTLSKRDEAGKLIPVIENMMISGAAGLYEIIGLTRAPNHFDQFISISHGDDPKAVLSNKILRDEGIPIYGIDIHTEQRPKPVGKGIAPPPIRKWGTDNKTKRRIYSDDGGKTIYYEDGTPYKE